MEKQLPARPNLDHLRRQAKALLAALQARESKAVATMLEHGIPNLLTDNTADFARFGGLITVVPLVP